MKKIVIGAIILPNDDSITGRSLLDALKPFGSVRFSYDAAFTLASTDGLTKEMWIYVSSDDSDSYVQVSAPGETEGKLLSEEEADQLQVDGVCTEFCAQYPRADRYGSPWYDSDNDFAAAVAGEHFKVAADGLKVFTIDRGDDGPEEIWLKIVLPE